MCDITKKMKGMRELMVHVRLIEMIDMRSKLGMQRSEV